MRNFGFGDLGISSFGVYTQISGLLLVVTHLCQQASYGVVRTVGEPAEGQGHRRINKNKKQNKTQKQKNNKKTTKMVFEFVV